MNGLYQERAHPVLLASHHVGWHLGHGKEPQPKLLQPLSSILKIRHDCLRSLRSCEAYEDEKLDCLTAQLRKCAAPCCTCPNAEAGVSLRGFAGLCGTVSLSASIFPPVARFLPIRPCGRCGTWSTQLHGTLTVPHHLRSFPPKTEMPCFCPLFAIASELAQFSLPVVSSTDIRTTNFSNVGDRIVIQCLFASWMRRPSATRGRSSSCVTACQWRVTAWVSNCVDVHRTWAFQSQGFHIVLHLRIILPYYVWVHDERVRAQSIHTMQNARLVEKMHFSRRMHVHMPRHAARRPAQFHHGAGVVGITKVVDGVDQRITAIGRPTRRWCLLHVIRCTQCTLCTLCTHYQYFMPRHWDAQYAPGQGGRTVFGSCRKRWWMS